METDLRDQNRAKRAAKMLRKKGPNRNNAPDTDWQKADKIVSPLERKKAIKAARHAEGQFSDDPSTYDKKRAKRKRTVKKMLKYKNKLSRNKTYSRAMRGVSKVGLGWGGAIGKRTF
jgi:hypothetical protein